MMYLVKWLAQATISASVACFFVITWLKASSLWRTGSGVEEIERKFTIQYPGEATKQNATALDTMRDQFVEKGPEVALWSGKVAFQTTLLWASVLVTCLCVVLLQQLESCSRCKQCGQESGFARLYNAVIQKVRRIAYFQLRPTRFWLAFCGGMTVLDMLLVVFWLALATWTLANSILRKWRDDELIPPEDPNSGILRLDQAGHAFGEVLATMMMLMFFPVSRSSFLQWLLGADFFTLIKYHRWMSWGAILLAFMHGSLYMIEWGSTGTLWKEFAWTPDPITKLYPLDFMHHKRHTFGLISLIGGCIIALTSAAWFRTLFYQAFYKAHIFGAFLFIAFGIIHNKNLAFLMPGLIFYCMDRAFRYFQMATNWTTITPHDVVIDGKTLTVALKCSQNATVQAGQHVYIRFPEVSWFQSHPFSIAEVHTEGSVTWIVLHIKILGSCTNKLAQTLKTGKPLCCQVEGPYDGNINFIKDQPSVVVMIAGGLGVTPLMGVLQQYADRAAEGKPVPQVYLSWSCRSLSDLKLIGTNLLAAATPVSTAACSKTHETVDIDRDSSSNFTLPVPGRTSPSSCHIGIVVQNITNTDYLSSAASWLAARLHYTGLEHEQATEKTQLLKIPITYSPGCVHNNQLDGNENSAPTTPIASRALNRQDESMGGLDAAESQPSAVVNKGVARTLDMHPSSSAALMCCSLMLSFFGGWGGLIASAAVDATYMIRDPGQMYLVNGTIQVFAIMFGAVIPTWAFLALCSWLRKRGTIQDDDAIMFARPAFLQQPRPVILPGYIMTPPPSSTSTASTTATSNGKAICTPSPEDTQHSIKLCRSRPNIPELLRAVRVAHADVSEVSVLVAGPSEMAHSVSDAIDDVNAKSKSGPLFRLHKVAHH